MGVHMEVMESMEVLEHSELLEPLVDMDPMEAMEVTEVMGLWVPEWLEWLEWLWVAIWMNVREEKLQNILEKQVHTYNLRRNILSQLQLIVLVWPSSPPDTAHLFIFELFVPILPRIQLI